MFIDVLRGVGLCAALLAPLPAVAQTYDPNTSPVSASSEAGTNPFEFVILNTSPFINVPRERVQVHLDYARNHGLVQYSLGQDQVLRDTLVQRVSQTYGMPLINAYGHFEWRVRYTEPGTNYTHVVTINVGEKLQSGYFIKADGRAGRRIINQSVPQKQAPLTSSFPAQVRPQIRGSHGSSLRDKP